MLMTQCMHKPMISLLEDQFNTRDGMVLSYYAETNTNVVLRTKWNLFIYPDGTQSYTKPPI
jgi:hypothetical protein